MSVITGHLYSSPVCAEWFDCYVLSVRHLLSIHGIFPLCYGFSCLSLLDIYPVCAEKFDCYVMSVRLLLSISGFFPLCLDFFPVCHYRASDVL